MQNLGLHSLGKAHLPGQGQHSAAPCRISHFSSQNCSSAHCSFYCHPGHHHVPGLNPGSTFACCPRPPASSCPVSPVLAQPCPLHLGHLHSFFSGLPFASLHPLPPGLSSCPVSASWEPPGLLTSPSNLPSRTVGSPGSESFGITCSVAPTRNTSWMRKKKNVWSL